MVQNTEPVFTDFTWDTRGEGHKVNEVRAGLDIPHVSKTDI